MKIVKYCLVIFLCLFSFYFSDRVILYIESKSPIMQEIMSVSDSFKSEPVNAIIKDNTIVPGKNGKVVNERESYLKMNDFGAFNNTFLVYDDIKPDVSLYDNLDKVIVGGADNNSVALIVLEDEIATLLDKEDILYTKVIYEVDEVLNGAYINGNTDKSNFKELNSFLKRKKLNDKLCLVGYSNMALCRDNKYFLISPTLTVYSSNLAYAKTQISGGKIILLGNGLNSTEVKIIISAIKHRDLTFKYLKDFISEE